MSAEKHKQLIKDKLLNKDGSRPPHIPPVSNEEQVVAEAETVVAQAQADPEDQS